MAREEQAEKQKVTQVTRRKSDWMAEHGFQIASEKTEMAIPTRQRRFSMTFQANVYGHVIEAVKAIKYLGILLDTNLTCLGHIQRAVEKA